MADLASVATGTPARFLDTGRSIPGRVFDTFVSVRAGLRRSHAYEELSRLSDVQLERRGLARRDLVRHVFETIR